MEKLYKNKYAFIRRPIPPNIKQKYRSVSLHKGINRPPKTPPTWKSNKRKNTRIHENKCTKNALKYSCTKFILFIMQTNI